MKQLKNFGSYILGVMIFFAIIFLAIIIIKGAPSVAIKLNPILIHVSTVLTIICVLVLSPLAFFRKTRVISATGFFIASYVFGLSAWVYGFLVTYALWGLIAVILGFFIAGVGVIPLGLLAAIFHGEWGMFGNLLYSTALVFIARSVASWLFVKIDRDEERAFEEAQEVLQVESEDISKIP